MPKGDKYIPLRKYLEGCGKENIALSFSDIEKIIGVNLPKSASKHRAFWSNTRTHSVGFGWLDAGYKTVQVSLKDRLITFAKA